MTKLGRKQKDKIYARVADAWDSLPSSEHEKIYRRRGRTEIAQMIHARHLSDVAYSSVERELRRVLHDRSINKTGKKPGR